MSHITFTDFLNLLRDRHPNITISNHNRDSLIDTYRLSERLHENISVSERRRISNQILYNIQQLTSENNRITTSRTSPIFDNSLRTPPRSPPRTPPRTPRSEPFNAPVSPIPRMYSERNRLPESLQPSYETHPTIDIFDSVIENQNNLNEQVSELLIDQERRTPTRLEVLTNRRDNITDDEIQELRNIQQGESKNPNGGKKRRRKTKKRKRRKSKKIRRKKSKKNKKRRKRKTKKRRK